MSRASSRGAYAFVDKPDGASVTRIAKRVIVLDSDTASAGALADAARALGYEVTAVAASYREALESIVTRRPQVALVGTDAHSCHAAIDAAAAFRRVVGLPIVFISSCDDAETIDRMRQARPLGVLLHPLAPAQLRVTIETACEVPSRDIDPIGLPSRLEQVFDWAGLGAALLDSRGAVVDVNRTLEHMLDIDRGSDLRLESLSLPEMASRERRLFEQLVAGESQFYRFECRYRRVSGELGVGYVTACMLGAGQRATALRLMSDISGARLEKIANFQENERHLISSEIHDAISQPLAGVFYRMQAVQQILDADTGRAHEELRASLQVVQRLLEELSRLIYNLRTPPLDASTVIDALVRLADEFRRESSIQLDLDLPERLPSMGRLHALFLYRIVQESLVNVRRHSGAVRARVSLQAHERALEGSIEDDGTAPAGGYERFQENRRRSFGIRSMRERAELLGGRLQVQPRSIGGTAVRFELPLIGEGDDQ